MPSFRIRFKLGRLMCMIALFALILAAAPTAIGVELAALLFSFAGFIVGVAAVGSMSRVRTTLWVCAGYPWLALASLYLTWLTYSINGRLSVLGDLTGLLLLGAPLAMLICPLLMFYEAVLTVERGGANRSNEVPKLVLIPLFLWCGAFAVFSLDPGGVIHRLIAD